MQKITLLYGLLLAPFLCSCYEDEGNYDYHEINEIEVENMLSNYAVDVDDSLIITPIVKGTLYSDTARFTYKWEIGGTTVGEQHDLRIQVDMVPGFKYSRLVVTDKETNVKKFHEFGVNVSSSTAGDLIMVLSKYQGRAELSYLRLDKPANWAVNYFQNRYETSLGDNPQQLAICYTESARNTPFVNRYGRVMVLADNRVNLIDKSSLMPDSITPYLTVDAYLQLVAYPKPEVENYKSEFVQEVIYLWRFVTYGAQQMNHFMEISAGRLFTAYSLAPSNWTAGYTYDGASPYSKGYLSPFGYWDDMSDTPHDNNLQAGYSIGDFIVFDKNNGRFASASAYGSISSIKEEDVKAFPGYTLLWGAATNRPNNTSIAVLCSGNQCRLVMLQNGKDSDNRDTKKLVGEIGGGSVMTDRSRFYMMKYNDNLFFSSGNAVYRYNIMDISSGTAPAERNKVFDLTQLGYDSNAVITDICVSRTEKTMLVGVSRYGNDAEAMGEEAKGDILYFDLDKGAGTLQYNEAKSSRGVAGIPVDVEIKYQTHYRNGEDVYGVLKDNI
jgi:hypothetical protein